MKETIFKYNLEYHWKIGSYNKCICKGSKKKKKKRSSILYKSKCSTHLLVCNKIERREKKKTPETKIWVHTDKKNQIIKKNSSS